MAVVGYLLYGPKLQDELTKNMLGTHGYPSWLKVVVLILIATLPLTKFPLQYINTLGEPSHNANQGADSPYCSAAPIVSTLEVATHIDPRAALLKPNRFNQSKLLTHTLRALFCLLVTAVAVIIAILVPSFEVFSALMGGTFGFLTCVILPIAFHLQMFKGRIEARWLAVDWVLIVVSAVLAVVGTVWEFLPRDWML